MEEREEREIFSWSSSRASPSSFTSFQSRESKFEPLNSVSCALGIVSCGPTLAFPRRRPHLGHRRRDDAWQRRGREQRRASSTSPPIGRSLLLDLDLDPPRFSSPKCPASLLSQQRPRLPTRTSPSLFLLQRRNSSESTGPRSRRSSPLPRSAARSSATTSARRPARSSL